VLRLPIIQHQEKVVILKAGVWCMSFLPVWFLMTPLTLHDMFIVKQIACKMLTSTRTYVLRITTVTSKQLKWVWTEKWIMRLCSVDRLHFNWLHAVTLRPYIKVNEFSLYVGNEVVLC
jgi:hypothetical protein